MDAIKSCPTFFVLTEYSGSLGNHFDVQLCRAGLWTNRISQWVRLLRKTYKKQATIITCCRWLGHLLLNTDQSITSLFCLATFVQDYHWIIIALLVNISLTEVKTSVVCWMVAILVHFHFWKSCTRVGLCNVAEGCVRKKVGKRWRLDRAGELDP